MSSSPFISPPTVAQNPLSNERSSDYEIQVWEFACCSAFVGCLSAHASTFCTEQLGRAPTPSLQAYRLGDTRRPEQSRYVPRNEHDNRARNCHWFSGHFNL